MGNAVEERAARLAVDTQQERRPNSHRPLQHGPLAQAQGTDKHVLFSAAKMEIVCLIATIDMSANTNTITGEEVMGD